MNRLFIFIFSFTLICLSASAQQPEEQNGGQNVEQGGQVKRRGFRPRFDATNPDVHDPVLAYEDGKYYIFSTGMDCPSPIPGGERRAILRVCFI